MDASFRRKNVNPAPEDRDPKIQKFAAGFRHLMEGLLAAARYPESLRREIKKIGELGDLLCLEACSMMFGALEARRVHFQIVRPRLYASLEERLKEGRIVEGQLLKAAQHPLAAEAMNETALAFNHDFRNAVQVPPTKEDYVRDALDARRMSEAYGQFKWDLLEFQNEVACAAYGKIQNIASMPPSIQADIERDFPQVDLRLLALALKRDILKPRDAFSVLTMPESYERMLSDLSDQVTRESLAGVGLELEI